MEKFATLEPVRLYNSATTTGARLLSRQQPRTPATPPLIGRLPSDLHLLILSYLPVPDFPAYARCTHATAGLSRSEGIWETRWKALASASVSPTQTSNIRISTPLQARILFTVTSPSIGALFDCLTLAALSESSKPFVFIKRPKLPNYLTETIRYRHSTTNPLGQLGTNGRRPIPLVEQNQGGPVPLVANCST